ncbi:hypothetical protein ACO1KQ_14855, partial [Staphylococcus aureus]
MPTGRLEKLHILETWVPKEVDETSFRKRTMDEMFIRRLLSSVTKFQSGSYGEGYDGCAFH